MVLLVKSHCLMIEETGMTNIAIGHYFKSTQNSSYTYRVTRVVDSRITLALQSNSLQHEVEIDVKDMPGLFAPIVQPSNA